MLEKENLTPFQIQLLLYYLTAEPPKRTERIQPEA